MKGEVWLWKNIKVKQKYKLGLIKVKKGVDMNKVKEHEFLLFSKDKIIKTI